MENLKRAEFTEWTLYQIGNKRFPWYFQISSINPIGDRVAVKIRFQLDPTTFTQENRMSNADMSETLQVYDCTKPIFLSAEQSVFDTSNNLIYHYKFADPRFIDPSIAGQTFNPGSIGHTLWNIACHDELRTPLVSKDKLNKMPFTSLSSTLNGDGDMFYETLAASDDDTEQKTFLLIYRFFDDKAVPLDRDTIFPAPRYRTEVERVRLRCSENKLAAVKNEWYDSANNLVYMMAADPRAEITRWIDIKQNVISPLSTLQKIFCPSPQVSK